MRAAIVFLVLLVAAPLASGDPAAVDIDVVVHAGVPATHLTSSELAEIYNGSRRSWSGGKPIIAFNLAPSNPLRIEMDRVILRMSPDEVGRYWIDQRIRGGSRPPRQIEDPAITVRLVAKLPGAIGYAPAGTAAGSDVRIVARIRNHKLVEPESRSP